MLCLYSKSPVSGKTRGLRQKQLIFKCMWLAALCWLCPLSTAQTFGNGPQGTRQWPSGATVQETSAMAGGVNRSRRSTGISRVLPNTER